MNNQSIKEILSAYRPNGSDARDPRFKEALEICRNDPELLHWFESQLGFDQRMAAALDVVKGPEKGKQAILTLAELPEEDGPFAWWRKPWQRLSLGLAAALTMTAVMIWLIKPAPSPENHFDAHDFAVSDLVEQVMPLDLKSHDREEVLAWLDNAGAPVPTGLPEAFELATVQGCRVYNDGKGGTISLFCLTMDGEFVHVLTFDENSRHYLTRPSGEWWREGEFNIIALEKGRELVAIATQLPTDRLAKYL